MVSTQHGQVLYVAGSIAPDGQDAGGSLPVRSVMRELRRAGYVVIAPQLDATVPDAYTSAVDEGLVALLHRCDALVLLPDWEKSPVAHRLVEEAREHDIPVHHWPFVPPAANNTQPGVEFFCFEGPAGSGKSKRVYQALHDRGALPYAVQASIDWARPVHAATTTFLPRPRQYTGRQLVYPYLQYVMDGVLALVDMAEQGGTAVFDRWVVSSFVYSCLDQGKKPDAGTLYQFVHNTARGMTAGLADAQLRGITPARLTCVTWAILLPPWGVYQQRRRAAEETGRAFKYDARAEYDTFATVVQILDCSVVEALLGVPARVLLIAE